MGTVQKRIRGEGGSGVIAKNIIRHHELCQKWALLHAPVFRECLAACSHGHAPLPCLSGSSSILPWASTWMQRKTPWRWHAWSRCDAGRMGRVGRVQQQGQGVRGRNRCDTGRMGMVGSVQERGKERGVCFKWVV